jgi:hypothetical protein
LLTVPQDKLPIGGGTTVIQDAYMEWQSALTNFENAEGKDMVDYYAYRIKASQIRYDYLLRKAKESYTN